MAAIPTSPAPVRASSIAAPPAMMQSYDNRRDALAAVLFAHPQLPLPGRGRTLVRWQALQSVAATDLVLAKLAEPHWDAQAILADCIDGGERATLAALHGHAGSMPRDAATPLWAVWAAEPPDARVMGHDTGSGLVLTGRKAWCSGAALVTHALVTYWNSRNQPCLAALRLDANGVTVTGEGWHAVGMAATASVDVVFESVPAIPIGAPGAYLERPGFWHGGMGIAACWLGGCVALARRVRAAQSRKADPHGRAHLGAIDVALSQAQALMRETAQWVDRHPQAPAAVPATRVRCAAESCATTVLAHAGRALGAGPMCRESATAALFADLPVFIRQSHAERDLAQLGEALAQSEEGAWLL